MTLKSLDYVTFLWSEIYSYICTLTPPAPWPSLKSGLPASQYHFATRSLPELTALHSLWYVWSPALLTFVKIVPLCIAELLSPIGLALWICDDGYWSEGTLFLCTDSFTLAEVNLLIQALETKFGLKAGLKRRIQANGKVCYRIRISSKAANIAKLRVIVSPFMLPSMIYKIGL
jgi:hypothetical protein